MAKKGGTTTIKLDSSIDYCEKTEEYLIEHKVESKINDILNRTLREQPDDPIGFIGAKFADQALSLKGILNVDVHTSVDGYGRPAVTAQLKTSRGTFVASVCCASVEQSAVLMPLPATKEEGSNLDDGNIRPTSAFDSGDVDEEASWPSVSVPPFHPNMERIARKRALTEAINFFKKKEVLSSILGKDPEADQKSIDDAITDLRNEYVDDERTRVSELKHDEDNVVEAKKTALEDGKVSDGEEKGDDNDNNKSVPLFDLSIKGISNAYDTLHKKQYAMNETLEVDLMLRHVSLAISIACARAGAADKQCPLYKHIASLADKADEIYLPVPVVGVINGGILSSSVLPFKTVYIIPMVQDSFANAIKDATSVDSKVRAVAKSFGTVTESDCGAIEVAFTLTETSQDEESDGIGALVSEKCMDIVFKALVECNAPEEGVSKEVEEKDTTADDNTENAEEETENVEVEVDKLKLVGGMRMALGCSAQTLFSPPTEQDIRSGQNLSGSYNMAYKIETKEDKENETINEETLGKIYRKYIEKYPIVMIEDAFESQGWVGSSEIVEEFGRDIMYVLFFFNFLSIFFFVRNFVPNKFKFFF